MNDNTNRATLVTVIKSHRRKMSLAQRRRGMKPQRWLYPYATEARYAALIRTWLRPMKDYAHTYIKENAVAVLRGDSVDFTADDLPALRLDAVPGKSFKTMINSLNGWMGQYVPDDDENKSGSPIYLGLGNIADSAFDFNEGQYEKGAKSVLGVEFPVGEDWWSFARDIWAGQNYDLIKSDMKNYIGQINTLTEKAVTSGLTVKELTKQIRGLDEHITKSRAEFIARDQIGKLNGQITQRRMEALGLTMYIWRTSNDERVRGTPKSEGGKYPNARPSHYLMNNKLCRWDDPTVYSEDGGKTWIDRPKGAVVLHPGFDYLCRCCAIDYWEELVQEADKVLDYEGPGTVEQEARRGLAYYKAQETRRAAESTRKKAKKAPEQNTSIERRFGKGFAEFSHTSMAYIDSAPPIPDTIRKEMESHLKRLKKTPEEFINEVNDFIKTGTVVRHERLDRFLGAMNDFEKDPRVKTPFETGTSQGALDRGYRNFWERRLIGKASNYGWKPSASDKTGYGISKANRPVYAEVTTLHPLEAHASQYGVIAFICAYGIRERTSFTLSGSSEAGVGSFKTDASSVFSKPDIDVEHNIDGFYTAQRKGSGGYIEAQVWGGIDLSEGDIKAVVIDDAVFIEKKDDESFKRFLNVLKDNHIAVIKSGEWGKK
jgi:hypothetical protein